MGPTRSMSECAEATIFSLVGPAYALARIQAKGGELAERLKQVPIISANKV
jgi:hypothetical protein